MVHHPEARLPLHRPFHPVEEVLFELENLAALQADEVVVVVARAFGVELVPGHPLAGVQPADHAQAGEEVKGAVDGGQAQLRRAVGASK